MTRLERIRARVEKRLISRADILYPHELSFRLGEYPPWEVHCKVKDPQRLKPDEVGRLQATASALESVTYQDLRVVKIMPGETVPFPGATSPWDDGTLEILDWSQASDFTGIRTGTAIFRRP